MARAPDSGTVCAVVVAYNRVELLRECLAALSAQTRKPDAVLVVDNASSDGTVAMVRGEFPAVEVLELETNQGGAGGFHEGMRHAVAAGHEWLWLMDDDTIAEPEALERLLGVLSDADPAPLLLASRVVWTDGTLHPMNAPRVAARRAEGLIDAAAAGLVLLRSASFVSLLVHRTAVERYGLPLKHYFIWNDDVEFTARVLRTETGYLVPGSVVCHKTATRHTPFETTGDRFYYAVRNQLLMVRGSAWEGTERLKMLWNIAYQARRYLGHNRWSGASIAVVLRGLRDGLRGTAR